MKTTTRFSRSRAARRGGFTLIELMVVITIIAALMALTASAVMKFIEVQQRSNTESTLDRTQSQLARAWSKVKDQAVRDSDTIPPLVLALAGADANALGRAKVLYIKLVMRQAFPMNFGEVFNVPYHNPELGNLNWNLSTLVPPTLVQPSPLPPLPGYASFLLSLGITPLMVSAQPYPDPRESAVCLLMALQRGVSGAGINPEELTRGGATGSMITPSGGNLPYLTDAWGRPIFFSRFPTGSQFLNPAGALAGANDPGDPQGYLNSPYWQTLPPLQQKFSQLALQQLAPSSSPPLSFKLAPMVASGGPANWTKSWPSATWPSPPPLVPPTLTLDPITFAPGYFIWPTGTFTPSPGSGALFSTP